MRNALFQVHGTPWKQQDVPRLEIEILLGQHEKGNSSVHFEVFDLSISQS